MPHLRFWFLRTADLPPEQDFLQGQETDRASVRAKRLIGKSQCDLQRALIQVRREAHGILV
jgi:hypothetical protein